MGPVKIAHCSPVPVVFDRGNASVESSIRAHGGGRRARLCGTMVFMEWVDLDQGVVEEYGSRGVYLFEAARLTAEAHFRVHIARLEAGGGLVVPGPLVAVVLRRRR